jgi:DNA-binding transcriptional LysR family regulator
MSAPEHLRFVEWEGLEALGTLSAVARAGSYRSAARMTGLSFRTLQVRITRLETALGYPVFRRTRRGLVPTVEGQQVINQAHEAEERLRAVVRMADRGKSDMAGPVTVAITGGMGTYWLLPRLDDFLERNPRIQVRVNATMRMPRFSDWSTDVSVQLKLPTDPDLKCIKIAKMHCVLSASERYAQLHGRMLNASSAAQHRFIIQEDDQVSDLDLLRNLLGARIDMAQCVMTDHSVSHYSAVLRHVGIGFAPTFAWATGARLRIMQPLVQQSYDVYLCYQADARKIPRLALMIDWLVELFNPKLYPWFRNGFVHPDDFDPRLIEQQRRYMTEFYV